MAKLKDKKTNAMRLLDQAGIPYRAVSYDFGDDFDGRHVAEKIGMPASAVFKTLVTRGAKGRIVICCLPVDKKLDLKALAKAAAEKGLEMIQVNELLPLTGYMRGGCSPLAMKKNYPAFFDESAAAQTEIAVSAGVRGLQIVLEPGALIRLLQAQTGRFAIDMD